MPLIHMSISIHYGFPPPSLEEELAEEREKMDTMEYNLQCDISELREELEEVQHEASFLRQYKTGYDELEASKLGPLTGGPQCRMPTFEIKTLAAVTIFCNFHVDFKVVPCQMSISKKRSTICYVVCYFSPGARLYVTWRFLKIDMRRISW